MGPRELALLRRCFDQQMWSFGRDVASPAGNLLVRVGAERRPAPRGTSTSSTYFFDLPGLTVELSSAKVIARCASGLARLERGPLEALVAQSEPRALGALLAWFARYEDAVPALAGTGWRAATLASRSRPPALSPEEQRSTWARLAALALAGVPGQGGPVTPA